MPRRGQPCGAGPHYRRAGETARCGRFGKFLQVQVAEKLFQSIDVDACVHVRAGAFALAGVEADASGQGGEGRAALEYGKGLFQAVLLEQMVVGPDIRSGRAGRHAGGACRLIGMQPEHVKTARFEALAAAGAFFGIDVSDQGGSSSRRVGFPVRRGFAMKQRAERAGRAKGRAISLPGSREAVGRPVAKCPTGTGKAVVGSMGKAFPSVRAIMLFFTCR